MSPRGQARRALILANVFELEREAFLTEALRPHRQNPFLGLAYKYERQARHQDNQSTSEDPKRGRILGSPRCDVRYADIARVSVSKRLSGPHNLLTVSQLEKEVNELVSFCCERKCDTVLLGIPDGRVPAMLSNKIEQLQERGLVVGLFSSSVNGRARNPQVRATYQEALTAVEKRPLRQSLGYIHGFRRPGIYGDVIFITIDPQVTRPDVDKRRLADFKRELLEIARSGTNVKTVVHLGELMPDERFLRHVVYQFENLGGACCFYCPSRVKELTLPFDIVERCCSSLGKAVANVNCRPSSETIEMPEGGWGIFNRPAYHRSLKAFVIPGVQDEQYFSYLSDLEVFLKSDLNALSKVAEGRLIINLHKSKAPDQLVERLRHDLADPIEKAGGILIIKSQDDNFSNANKRLSNPLLVLNGSSEIRQKLDHHVPIPPCVSRWVYVSRPERSSPDGDFLVSGILSRAGLSENRRSPKWPFLAKEIEKMRSHGFSGLICKIDGLHLSKEALTFLAERGRLGSPRKTSLYFLAQDSADRLAIRNSGVSLPGLYKRPEEAMLHTTHRLSPPSGGWEVFALDPVRNCRRVVCVSFADSDEATSIVFGRYIADKVAFIEEVNTLLSGANDVIFKYPETLGLGDIQSSTHMQWAIEGLYRSGKLAIGVHSSLAVLEKAGFSISHSCRSVDEALKSFGKRWR